MTGRQIQQQYRTAKAAYHAAITRHNALLEASTYYARLEAEAPLDELVAIELGIEAQSGHTVALRAYHEAEKALLTWAEAIVQPTAKKTGGTKAVSLIAELFQQIQKHPRFKPQLVNLCLRLAA